jgi:hypothetical protein
MNLVCAVVFRLSKDPQLEKRRWLFGGDEQREDLAAKAAAHELKGSNHYLRCALSLNSKRVNPTVFRLPMQVSLF